MSEQVHAGLGIEGVETPYPESPFVVMKFGGRSVATAQNWATIAHLLRQRLDEGIKPVVVHSALAGISNALEDLLLQATSGNAAMALDDIRQRHEQLATELGVDAQLLEPEFQKLRQLIDGVRLVGEVSPRVHARVMATGELAATTLGVAYLQGQGLPAHWRDARELLESETDRDQTERARVLTANCNFAPNEALQAELSSTDGFVLTQGFIGNAPIEVGLVITRVDPQRLAEVLDRPADFAEVGIGDPAVVVGPGEVLALPLAGADHGGAAADLQVRVSVLVAVLRHPRPRGGGERRHEQHHGDQ